MFIGDNYLEEMFQFSSVEDFYEFYPKEEYQSYFDGIKKLYGEGKYRLIAKQWGVMLEPTLNYLMGYNKKRSPILNALVKSETSDEVLAHFAAAMILDSYEEGRFVTHGDPDVTENLNYFEFHELDDRENVRAYYESVALPQTNNFSTEQLHNEPDDALWSHIETTLWQWADKFHIPDDTLPRDRKALMELTELEIISQGLITPLKDVADLAKIVEVEEEKEAFYLPVELFKLTELTKLEVFGMNLTYLPDEVEELEKLTELKLTMNHIEMIPSSVGNLENLTTIDLSINWLEEIPLSLVKLKNLKYLNVSSEKLTITSSQENWLYTLIDDGCEVIWDREDTQVIGSEDEEDEELQYIRDLIELFGGEEALMDAMKNTK